MVLADMLHERHGRLCQIEDEFVVSLVCTPDDKSLNCAMEVALEWVQERQRVIETLLEGCR